jgi:uncharacterized protein (DUF1330 family)
MTTNRSIDPTADQVRALRDSGAEGPIVMVNMLKYRKRAAYPADFNGDGDVSGEEAYRRYERAFVVSVGHVSKAEVLYMGPVQQVFIGAAGAPESDWDAMLIVRYPSKDNFLAMMANEEYRRALVHRYAALERTVLLRCSG